MSLKDNKKMNVKKPPKNIGKSFQLDIFSNFLTNENDPLKSNAIELWDSFPKYHLSKSMQTKLRGADGLAAPFDWPYEKDGIKYVTRIQPASIEDENGKFKSYFPSEIEELVEEALKRIMTEQNHGIHMSDIKETWVRFSIQELRKELISVGRAVRLPRLKQALEIMSSCILSVYRDGEKDALYRGPILSELFITSRADYIKDSSNLCTARLPVFISHSIDKLKYRQFNYECYMGLKKQFSRWLFKKLVNKFTQAGIMSTYNFSLNTVTSESGHLQASVISKRKKLCEGGLDELKASNVISSWEIKNTKMKGKTIIDVIYILVAHPEFIGDQRAASKRLSQSNALLDKKSY